MEKSFEINGYWWLPITPARKISGIFSYSPGDKMTLKLLGELNEVQEEGFNHTTGSKFELIHGLSSTGEAITLCTCIQIGASSGFGEAGKYSETEFITQNAFIGCYFNNLNEIKFSSLSVRYFNLDNWYNKSNINPTKGDPDVHGFTYHIPEPIDIYINDIHLQIELRGRESNKFNSISYTGNLYINLTYSTSKPFDEIFKFLRLIQNFFSLAISEPTFVIEMTAWRDKELHEDKPAFIRVYYADSSWQVNAHEVFWAHMLLPYSKVESELPNLLKNWIKNAEIIKPVYDLYFSGMYHSLYLENDFLNLTQSLESFHRRVYGGQYQEDEIFLENLYKMLVSAIPQDIPSDFRSSLVNGKLRYANEFSLRKRIRLICEHISEHIPITFLLDRHSVTSFSEKISDTRNYLTHYSTELKEKAAISANELFEINLQLRLILTISFLEILDIPMDKIKDIVKNDIRFRDLLS